MAKRKQRFIQETPMKPRSELDKNGHEIPDSRTLAPALNLRPEPTLAERIREITRSERLRQEALAAGQETFEEADDFEVGDDYDPESPYEMDFDPGPRPQAAPPQAEPSKATETTQIVPEPAPAKTGPA